MPTTRPRHAITETPPVAQALDDAARRWPEDRHNRARLLLRLIEQGHVAISGAEDANVRRQVEAVEATYGVLDGVFATGYLEELRADWPR